LVRGSLGHIGSFGSWGSSSWRYKRFKGDFIFIYLFIYLFGLLLSLSALFNHRHHFLNIIFTLSFILSIQPWLKTPVFNKLAAEIRLRKSDGIVFDPNLLDISENRIIIK
jgi:hypothetical protein